MRQTRPDAMLHIHCGDCSAEQLRRSGVAGTVHVIHDPVCCGPLPGDRQGEDWYRMRAEYLAGTGVPFEPAELARNLAAEDAVLDDPSAYGEVVLWFDHCLFDQSILVRALDRLSRAPRPRTRLSLVCVGGFPGFARFKGLGELSPAQMSTLLPTRHEVTEGELRLAARAWAALCSDDPRGIESLIADDTSALPYLGDALRRHLEQFPSVRTGLSRTEEECLCAVAGGHTDLVALFNAVSDMEPRPFLGDTMLWDWVDQLARAPNPALCVTGPGAIPRWDAPADCRAWSVALTGVGRALRDGVADWIRLNGTDRWVGGVRLHGRNEVPWRWDEAGRRLVRAGG